MPRSTTRKKPLIDWAARNASVDALQECYRLGDSIQDTADELEAQAAHRREVARCHDDFERHPAGHPSHAAALQRLAYLRSRRSAALRHMRQEVKKFARRTKRELIIGLALPIDLLFIAVFNGAALMLLFWLLSLL